LGPKRQCRAQIVTRQVLVRGYGGKEWRSRLTLAIARILLTKNGEHSSEEVSLERMAVVERDGVSLVDAKSCKVR
jgi:hypothetical protein